MKATIAGLRYDTGNAIAIASNNASGCPVKMNNGRSITLYMTTRGHYFLLHKTLWSGEEDHIEPIGPTYAREMWDVLPSKFVDWDVAFPDHPAKDA